MDAVQAAERRERMAKHVSATDWEDSPYYEQQENGTDFDFQDDAMALLTEYFQTREELAAILDVIETSQMGSMSKWIAVSDRLRKLVGGEGR